jgi:hypothetical protein
MIMTVDIPIDEADRLSALRELNILDTEAEKEFDELTVLAAQICLAPIALISLIDEQWQWLKSRVGLNLSETSRDIAFCTLSAIHWFWNVPKFASMLVRH